MRTTCTSKLVLTRVGMTIAVLLLLPVWAQAQDRPRKRSLVLTGLAVGVPTYVLGVSIHEGSHAIAGKLLGARITDYSLVPGFHPRTGKFYFGYVTVHGLRTNRQRALFLAAPKLTDTLALGSFAALYAGDVLPANAYANTAALVLATGFWVDFSKDIFSFVNHNDTVKLYNMIGLTSELKRLPARLLHAGLSAAMGYAIFQGYKDLFARELKTGASSTAVVMPMWDMEF